MSLLSQNALSADPAVVLVGETATAPSGPERKTLEASRRLETPIAERGTLGFALGLAMAGKKPIVEISSTQRLFTALELIDEAAEIGRSGEFPATLVVRVACGDAAGRIDRPILDNLTAIDGLNVAIARDASVAAGLLLGALATHRPTVLLEPRVAMHGHRRPNAEAVIECGTAEVLREGTHATLLAFGTGVAEALRAAEGLAKQGIDVDVIDLVSASPLDTLTLARRVCATGRLIIADGGDAAFARQLAQVALDHAFDYLEAPPAIAADAPSIIAAVHAAIQY